jgi:hypothetical protein
VIVSANEAGNSGRSPRAFDFAHRVCRESYEAKATASSRQTFRQYVRSHDVCSQLPVVP